MSKWKRRSGPEGGLEFCRPGPFGIDVCVWQPRTKARHHELYWYICWGVGIVLRDDGDNGRYPDVFEAIATADALVASGAFDGPKSGIKLSLSRIRLFDSRPDMKSSHHRTLKPVRKRRRRRASGASG